MTTLDDDGSVALDDPIGTGGPIISAPTPTPISLSGDGSLTVSDGTLNLTGANTYTGTTTVTTNGTLSLQNPAGSATGTGNVTVNSGSTLDGNGSTTGSVTVAAGATIDPGVGTQTSTLNTGSVTFDSGSIFTAQINSTTSYDQLNVNGNVILNNPTLTLNGTPTTQPGDQLTIIDNAGTDAVGGTGYFANDAEGSTISYGGHQYSITYFGGANGNSVVLTDVTPPTAPTNLTAAVISPNEIDLNWSGSSSLTTEYDVFEQIAGAWVPYDSVDSTQSSYNVTGLSPGTSYGFEVVASDVYANSAAASVSATTATPPVVTAAGDTVVTEGGTYTLSLSSDSGAANADTVAGWDVDWGDGNPIYYPGASPTINFPVSSGWAGLVIVATAQTAGSALVPPYAVQADPVYVDVIPNAPALVSATVNSASDATITWTDNSLCDSGVTLLRADNGSGVYNSIMTFAPGDGSYDDTSLAAASTYQYEVETTGGLTGQAVSAPAVSQPLTTPSSDLGLSLAAGSFTPNNGTINASWTYSGSDVSNWELEDEDTNIPNTNYQLVAAPGTGTQSYPIAAITGDTYNIRLRADYTDGTVSSWDKETFSLTPTLIPTVSVRQNPNNTNPDPDLSNSVQVIWTLPASATGDTVGIYYRGTTTDGLAWIPLDCGDSSDGWQFSQAASPMSLNIGDGQTATFKVIINTNQGGWSISQPITQMGTAGPSPDVTVTDNGNGTATISWAGNSTDTGGYDVFTTDQPYATPNAAAGDSFDGTAPTYIQGTSYTFTVSPGDHIYAVVEAPQIGTVSSSGYIEHAPGYGTGDVQIAGAPLPGSPTNLVVTLTGPTTAFLHWDDNSCDETAFQVYRSDDPAFNTDVELIGTTDSDANQYTDTLPDYQTYYYEVYAYDPAAATTGPTTGNSPPAPGDSTNAATGAIGALNVHSLGFQSSETFVRDDTGHFGEAYVGLQWLDVNNNGIVTDAGDHDFPISYRRSLVNTAAITAASSKPNSKMTQISVNVVLTNPLPNGWQMKGTADDDGQPLNFIRFANAGMTFVSNPLSQQIDDLDLAITWSVSPDGKNWSALKSVTHNHLYQTGAALPTGTTYETAVAISCEGGIKKIPTLDNSSDVDHDIVNGIFAIFATRSVSHRQNGVPVGPAMLYWGTVAKNWNNAAEDPTSLPFLLKHSDGRCGGWNGLFLSALLIAGETRVVDTSITPPAAGEDVAVPSNEAAQGGIPLQWHFANHAVSTWMWQTKSGKANQFNYVIYDPSYGVKETITNVNNPPAARLPSQVKYETDYMAGEYIIVTGVIIPFKHARGEPDNRWSN